MLTADIPPSRLYQHHHLDSTRWNRYIPRDDDIIISTSYKSGTTWTQGIVRELIAHEMRQAGITDPTQLPDLDRGSSPWLDGRWSRTVDELHTKIEAQTHRRFLKTHLAMDGLPIYNQVKYLIVARDPRDVFMSMWNHYSAYTDHFYDILNNNPEYDGSPHPRCPADIHDFWSMWINRGWFDWEQEGYPFWGNMAHTQSWWPYRQRDNILMLHYADMLADPPREIRHIADFLGIAISDEALAQVVEETSLSAMRERAVAVDAEEDEPQTFRGGSNTFFYKGTNGRWRSVLTEAELAMYERTRDRVLTPDCARWLEQGKAAIQTQES
jgi:aryl sulfotransferase